jgi:hypothetical protein
MNRHFVDYNAIPAACAQMADPAKTPSQIAAELAEARRKAQAADAEAYKSMKAPASASKPRDPPYQPADFAFQHHGPKGLSGELIPQRPKTSSLAVDPLDALAERVCNDEGMYARLREHRGGCTCFISPPCGACCNPLTQDEAEALGWLDETEQQA